MFRVLSNYNLQKLLLNSVFNLFQRSDSKTFSSDGNRLWDEFEKGISLDEGIECHLLVSVAAFVM